MNTTFAQLKKNRKTNFDKLSAELEKASGKSQFEADERFWYPAVDKVGNGYAVVRFLPPPKGEDLPFVRVFEHGFQGPTGAWYIEKSLTTLGKNDPVSEFNSILWNKGKTDSSPERQQARKQKRRLTFISNVYVVEDPTNPENEGKVVLYKYGKKIFDKLYAASNPEFKDETKMDPFDLWEANLKIKIRQVEGYRNYDKSEFDKSGPLGKDDFMQAVWEKAYPIAEFVDPKNFKSYSELKDKFNHVMGLGDTNGHETEGPSWNKDTRGPKYVPEEEVSVGKELEADTAIAEVSSVEEDEDKNFFKRIAEETEESLFE